MIKVGMRRTIRPAQYESLEFSVEADSESGITTVDATPQEAANQLRYFAMKQVIAFEVQHGVRERRSAVLSLAALKADLHLKKGDVDQLEPMPNQQPLEAAAMKAE